jgi:hypothetical protein
MLLGRSLHFESRSVGAEPSPRLVSDFQVDCVLARNAEILFSIATLKAIEADWLTGIATWASKEMQLVAITTIALLTTS